MTSTAVYHHGIKGMKWGVRRTPEQLGHRPKPRLPSRLSKSKPDDTQKQSTTAKKSYKEMTDDELKAAIARLDLEKKYKELSRPSEQVKVNRGKKIAMDILEKAGANIGNQLATYAMGTIVNKVAGKEIVNPKKGQKDK